MKISADISYPDTEPDQAYALSVDPAFRVAVCEATHALDHDVSVQQHDDATASVVVRRTMAAEVPDFMKKFIGETVDVVQTEEWGGPDGSGQRTADLVLEIKGQPATMIGTASIVRTPDGSAVQIRGELKVSIPFIGGKIESEVAKGIYAAVKREQETGTAWLS